MKRQVAVFRWVPPFAQGYVRDLRVRWALEEAGFAYEEAFVDLRDKGSAYRAWQPFGQVPAYRDDEVEMFESGAIVLHLAGRSDALSPQDTAGLARTTTWVLAALNSVEPFVAELVQLDAFHAGESWIEARRPQARAALDGRLASLADWLGGRDWLEERFGAGDLMMITVLRELVESGVLASFPTLDTYRARGEARPAFQKALADQLATFAKHAPA